METFKAFLAIFTDSYLQFCGSILSKNSDFEQHFDMKAAIGVKERSPAQPCTTNATTQR